MVKILSVLLIAVFLTACAVTEAAQVAEGKARVKAAQTNDIAMIRSYRFICNARPTTERRFLAKFRIKQKEFDKFCTHLSGL